MKKTILVIAMLLLAIVPCVMAVKTTLYKFPGNMLVTGNLQVQGVIKGSWYKQISWYDITNIPAGFKDGIDNTDDLVDSSELDNICDVDGSIMKRIDGEWVCSEDEVGTTEGLTDDSSYWLCTSSDCLDTCQVIIENGLITDCESCEPKSCTDLGHECGEWSDGCEGLLNCGNCDEGYKCIDGTCVEEEVKTINLYPIEDASAYSSYPTYNGGKAVYIGVLNTITGSDLIGYIMFDISDLIGKNIINSKLKFKLFSNCVTTRNIEIYNVLVYNWKEGSHSYYSDVGYVSYEEQLTWANQMCGTSFDNSELCKYITKISVISSDSWVEFDIPSTIYNGNKVSFALRVEEQSDDCKFYPFNFASKDYIADTTLIPYLEIKYIE